MLKIYCLIFAQLLCIIAKSQYTDYDDFFKSLKIDSSSVAIDSLEYDVFWKSFLSAKRDSVIQKVNEYGFIKNRSITDPYQRPQTKPFLSRTLKLNGVEVIELKSKEANGRVGFTKCVSSVPHIIYSQRKDPRISIESFVFFREHEYGHFKLGHSGCGVGSTIIDNYEKEFEADMEACKTILIIHADGIRIMDFVVSTFLVMNTNPSRTHPASQERAFRLWSLNKK